MQKQDAKDREILRLLQADSSLSYQRIGTSVGLSISAVNERVRKLERMGVITGYCARLDRLSLGYPIMALLHLTIAGAHENAFLDWVKVSPIVLECHRISGQHSYTLKLLAGSLEELDGIRRHQILPFIGTGSLEISIVMASEKDTIAVPT